MMISKGSAALAFGAAVGLMLSGCARSAEAPPAPTAVSASSPSAQAPAATDLTRLLPTPEGTKKSKGPDSIADRGIHQYFEVSGEPNGVMNAFKSALEGNGWDVTTIVSSGGGHGGGGATYTGTHGDAYGVFDGGGYDATTYIDVCVWPTKPANPNCQSGSGR